MLSIVLLIAVHPVATPMPTEATRSRPCPPLAMILASASDGLLMPSETDAPFTPLCWNNAERTALTIPRLLRLTGHPPATAVEIIGLDEFFRNVAQPQPWHDSTQARNVRRFRHLVKVLRNNLSSIRVYRVGTIRVAVYIVGSAGGAFAGLSTVVVET